MVRSGAVPRTSRPPIGQAGRGDGPDSRIDHAADRVEELSSVVGGSRTPGLSCYCFGAATGDRTPVPAPPAEPARSAGPRLAGRSQTARRSLAIPPARVARHAPPWPVGPRHARTSFARTRASWLAVGVADDYRVGRRAFPERGRGLDRRVAGLRR